MNPATAYLLLVLQTGNPVPLFVIPMADAHACAINMAAMLQVLKDDADAVCFEMASQTFHAARRAPERGEKIE